MRQDLVNTPSRTVRAQGTPAMADEIVMRCCIAGGGSCHRTDRPYARGHTPLQSLPDALQVHTNSVQTAPSWGCTPLRDRGRCKARPAQ